MAKQIDRYQARKMYVDYHGAEEPAPWTVHDLLAADGGVQEIANFFGPKAEARAKSFTLALMHDIVE